VGIVDGLAPALIRTSSRRYHILLRLREVLVGLVSQLLPLLVVVGFERGATPGWPGLKTDVILNKIATEQFKLGTILPLQPRSLIWVRTASHWHLLKKLRL